MRRTARVMALLALGLPTLGATLGAATASAQDAKPEFAVDETRLPPLLIVQPKAERDRQSLIAAGIGAVAGIVVADVVTGGLLLLPLGLPSFSSLVGGGAGAAAGPPS